MLDQLVDWIYGQIVGFLGNFFALMGNMSLGDIDRAIAELGKQFDHLLLEASSTGDPEG